MMISVIVPVYNVEKYLRKCVESICNQTYKDNRIKVIHKQNGGSTSARNAGLAVSTGEYIGFVDSDDWIEPEIIYYDMEIRNEGIWAKEQSAHRNNVFVFNTLFKDGKDFYVKLTEHSELIVEAWRQMIRKDFLLYNAISFYDGIYHEDVLFSFKCAMKAVKVSYLQKELYVYRRRDNSIMSAYNFKRAQSLFIVIIELWNMWKNEAYEDSVDKVFERALTNFYKEFIRISSCYWDMELSDFGSAADKFLYPIMSGKKMSEFQYVDFSVEKILQMKKASQIMVYGAGGVGREVILFLRNHNISVKCILVSDKGCNAENLLGIPIIQFDTVEIEKDTMIIVSVVKNNKEAIDSIVRKLHERLLNNIMSYDGERY